MAAVYISIGSNLERERNITSAVRALRAQFGELNLSIVYESDAVGFDGAAFLNLVAGLRTELSPEQVQARLKTIEADHGRSAAQGGFRSRSLDLDMLLYDDLILQAPGLRLPREEITRFAFVLTPLAQIAPGVLHPQLNETLSMLAQRLHFDGQVLTPFDLNLQCE